MAIKVTNPTGFVLFEVDETNQVVRINGQTLNFPSTIGYSGGGLSTDGSGNLTWNMPRGIVFSPVSLAADVNNYAPGIARYYRLTSSTDVNITGLVAQPDGFECCIINIGSNNITLNNQSASSIAANRFISSTGSDITLTQNQMVALVYCVADASWRIK